MRTEPATPWRGPGPGRPALPLPPGRMPLLRGGRPLKRWTWVGAFGPELMLCAARAWIGGVPIAWWAVWDRPAGRLVERSARGAGGGVAATGWLARGGRRRALALRAVVDESAGYHARETAWRWSAGVGTAASGARVAWNLVAGLHDAATSSERTVWIDGVPREVGPVAFEPGLAWVAPAGDAPAGGLRFAAEVARARREDLRLVASDYEQPFGTFAGALPGVGELRTGWGVMERHEARW